MTTHASALAIICMVRSSSSPVTAGQLSLAQAVIAGIGALAAAKVSAPRAVHLPHSSSIGAVAAAGARRPGRPFPCPSGRAGVTLAIATPRLGECCFIALVLSNVKYTGGQAGIVEKAPVTIRLETSIPLFKRQPLPRFVVLDHPSSCWPSRSPTCAGGGNGPPASWPLRSNERAAAALGLPSSMLKAYAFRPVGGDRRQSAGVLLAFRAAPP